MKTKLLILLVFFLIPACDLDEEILDEVSGARLMAEPGSEASFAASSYGHLCDGFNGDHGPRILNENVADERVTPTRGDGWTDLFWGELHKHSWTIFNPKVQESWDWIDQGVSRTNTGLYFLNQMDPSDEVLHYIAELSFLRTLYRYMQLDLFRQAPMRSEFDLNFEQAPLVAKGEDLFNQLEGELIEVIALLRDRNDTPYGRITRAAAQMLLAKMYLNAEVYTGSPKWAESLAMCNKIISSGQYSINTNYFDIFSVDNHDNSEAVFVVRRDRNAELVEWSFQQSWKSSMHLTFTGVLFGAYNGPAVVSDFFYTWDQDGDPGNGVSTTDSRFYDDRIKPSTGANLGFVMGPQFYADGTKVYPPDFIFPPDTSQVNFTIDFDFQAAYDDGIRVIKYEPDLLSSNLMFSNNDFMIFRYADLWLMAAEAKFRLGNVGEALIDINNLRGIRGAPLLTSLNEQDILDERGFELYWEGWRRQDLIRFDQFTRPWANKEQSEKYREVFPIPKTALATNGGLEQNPGY